MPDEDRGWHLRKEVNFGHLLTTGGLIVSALWWSSKIDSRMQVVERTQTSILVALKEHQSTPGHRDQVVDFKVFEAKITGQMEGIQSVLAGMESRITADILENSTRISRQWDVINQINNKLRKVEDIKDGK